MNTNETTTTADPFIAPHHRESYNRFLQVDLPALLGKVLPLDAYTARQTSDHAAELTLVAAMGEGTETRTAVLTFANIPWPDENGIFRIESSSGTSEGSLRVVLPTASDEDLSIATIRCVGDFLVEEIAEHLNRNLESLTSAQSTAALQAAMPLDEWIRLFFGRTQYLDKTNYLARHTHTRRIRVLGNITGFSAGQIGRVCPIENPEGPNTGRILTLSRGAMIRDGRIVVIDDSPAARLGISTSLIPFVAHSEPARLMMGANMIRQWKLPINPEPPLVQTGCEPSPEPGEDLWCGLNLLTAFVSYGMATHEDGLLVSESCAARLFTSTALSPGDKLSNRHGSKGVVAQILPDTDMPHLPDGTPVEIVYSVMSAVTRMNHGQLLEAALSRVARAEGKTAIASPFASPSADEIRSRLAANGLPETGQVRLRAGRNGELLDRPSSVGYVYWGRIANLATGKITVGGAGEFSLREYSVLREIGATNLLADIFGGDSAIRRMENLQQRLGIAGIALRSDASGLALTWTDVKTKSPQTTIELAEAIPHPWQRARQIVSILVTADLPELEAIRHANDRLRRITASGAPASLGRDARADLERSVVSVFRDLLRDALLPASQPAFSARGVAAPGPTLAIDEIGLPEPVVRAFWPEATDDNHSIDALLADKIVLVNGYYPLSLVACRPVRLPSGENAIRLHPALCTLLDSDFDGDQLLVTLPQSSEAQEDALTLLSPAAILARAPDTILYGGLHAGLFGVAYLSRSEAGRTAISEALSPLADLPAGLWTKQAQRQVLGKVLQTHGAAAMLKLWDRLLKLGFAAAKQSGASLRPFVGETLALPPKPTLRDPSAWALYAAQIQESLDRQVANGDFDDTDTGLPLLAAASGARGRVRFVALAIGAAGSQIDGSGIEIAMTHGWREGYDFDEIIANAAAARRYWRKIYPEFAEPVDKSYMPVGTGVLARAMRSAHPGVVFASAAERGEIDPLTDLDSQIFMGLPLDA